MNSGARKICFVTGSRADFGLLVWQMRAIRETSGLTLQLIATGMHLAPEFGYTFNTIRDEGFEVDERPRHWGAARCFVRAPGGHRVELMAAPPPARG